MKLIFLTMNSTTFLLIAPQRYGNHFDKKRTNYFVTRTFCFHFNPLRDGYYQRLKGCFAALQNSKNLSLTFFAFF